MNSVRYIKDIMTSSLIQASIDKTFDDVLKLMYQHQVSSVVIVEDKHPIGICSYLDVINAISNHKSKQDIKLSEIINKNITTIYQDESIYDAYQKLIQSGQRHLVVLDANNHIAGILTGSDLFKHIEFNEQLKFKTIFDLSPDAILIINPNDLSIVNFNSKAINQLGFSSSELLTLKISDLDPITTPFYTNDGVAELEKFGHTIFESKQRVKNGSFIDVQVFLNTITYNEEKLIIAFYKDITQEKLYESKLTKITNYDSLTGLASQYLFKSYLKHILLKRNMNDRFVGVLKIDIDDFGNINNSLGHDIGDEVLQLVSTKIYTFLRQEDLIGRFESDLLSRFGGDEFGVIIEDLKHKEDLIIIASRIISNFNKLIVLQNGFELYLSISIGISVVPYGSATVEEVIDFADIALRNTKAVQKGGFMFYDDTLSKIAKEKLETEMKLRQVVENNELQVYYQPQVEIKTGKIKGVEALVRWINKDGVIISPASFIPMAEDVGCIFKIGRWVLCEACKTAKTWFDDGCDFILSVNLSMQQILHDDIIESIKEILESAKFPAEKLELEITESSMMADPARVIYTLYKIKSLGVKLAIDDFGTGYSSLAYLKKFPIDTLKIDKSFIDDLPNDKDSIALVKTILAMAKALGYKTIAEGVENAEQLDFLRLLECDLYQGYLKSQPINKHDFKKLIREESV